MLIILILTLISLILAIDTFRLGITPMPTSNKAGKILIESVGNGLVYELGSGFGSLSIALSKNNRVFSFEKALIPWLTSLFLKALSKRENLSIYKKDIFQVDLSNADIVICYLYPKAMQKLAPKFEQELKNGALVLSNSFHLPGKKPEKVIEVNDWMRSRIYCYRFFKPNVT